MARKQEDKLMHVVQCLTARCRLGRARRVGDPAAYGRNHGPGDNPGGGLGERATSSVCAPPSPARSFPGRLHVNYENGSGVVHTETCSFESKLPSIMNIS